jgi:hypothetical protein
MPPTYLRVKKALVSEFGLQRFREHRVMIQDQLLVVSNVGLPSTIRASLRSMHDVVRGACHESKSNGTHITWMSLKRELVERFGAAKVESFKKALQMWLVFYAENEGGDRSELKSPQATGSGAGSAVEQVILKAPAVSQKKRGGGGEEKGEGV